LDFGPIKKTGMSKLLTDHPIALGYLFNETLFALPSRISDEGGASLAQTAEIEEKQAEASASALPSWNIQGKVGNPLAFFVLDPNHAFLSESSWLAFSKTLQALGISSEEVTLFNLAQCASPSEAQSLLLYVQASQMIGLGVQPHQWDIQPNRFPSIQFLWTSSYEEMLDNIDKKRTFWNQIKQFLGK
jgi:hypothetical protein